MSENINSMVVSGNLTRDPELRQTQGGTAVLSLRLASNGRRRDSQTGQWEDEPCFLGVTVWGARAEALARILARGSRVTVQGRLRWREWAGEDGARREALEVVADNVELPPRQQGAAAQQSQPQAAQTPPPGQYDPGLQAAVNGYYAANPPQAEIYDDQIPF